MGETRRTEVYAFHGHVSGLPDLFHASCADHPDFGFCGVEAEAYEALAQHLRTHDLAAEASNG